jgi:hypothetical protein
MRYFFQTGILSSFTNLGIVLGMHRRHFLDTHPTKTLHIARDTHSRPFTYTRRVTSVPDHFPPSPGHGGSESGHLNTFQAKKDDRLVLSFFAWKVSASVPEFEKQKFLGSEGSGGSGPIGPK